MPTIEEATFNRDHLGFIQRMIKKGIKKVFPEEIKKLEKHIKDSKRLEETLDKAIKGYEAVKKDMNKIRRSNAWKRLSTMTKKGYENIRKEAAALVQLEDAHEERKQHLEYIRQTRGEASTFVKEWKASRK